jgi:hypothetical protein
MPDFNVGGKKMGRSGFLAAVFLLTLATNAFAVQVQFNGFSDTSGLTLNGATATASTADGIVLRLTPASGGKSGSAFSSQTVNAATFSTFFKFRITNPGGSIFDCNAEAGADGIVFVVQSVSSDIGGTGQGIGYSGIDSSVGVEFDTWCNAANNDPSSNHLGIDTDGSVNHGAGSLNTVNVTPNFDNGQIWYAWVDYNGTTLEARVSQSSVRPATPKLTRVLDIPSILGQNSAYVGFTSGTGSDWGNHDILYWEYRDSFDPIQGDPSAGGCCSEYDFSTNTLSIPCLKIGGQTYWAELELVSSSGQVLLRLKDFGEGSQCTDSSPNNGDGACSDCSCPEYAAAHPDQCGQTGDLNFRLTWNDLNDVDLHVVYDNGSDLSEEIYFNHKVGVAGGELDVDANAACATNVTDQAVENIFYQDPGPGTYTMKVCGYKACGTDSSSVTAQILVSGAVVWQGQINVSQWGNTCVDVHTQTVQ